MKKKTYKIFGVGLVVMVIASLLVFAIPTSAAPAFPAKANKWVGYGGTTAVPVSGALGGWFYDQTITGVGPIAKDKDGATLYAYVHIGSFYLTDGNPSYPPTLDGDYFTISVDEGARGIVTLLSWSGTAYFVTTAGSTNISAIPNDDEILGGFSWEWEATSDGTVIQIFATGDDFSGLVFHENGDTATYTLTDADDPDDSELTSPAGTIYKSVDSGHSWTTSTAGGAYSGGPVIDMVCSEQDAETLYVTDGNYVYKSEDGADNFSIVAQENLEYNLEGDCGVPITSLPITCIDVGYNGVDEAIVFIGTRNVGHVYIDPHPSVGYDIVGSVYWINEDTYPAEWDDLQLSCYGCCDNTDGEGDRDGCFDVYAVAAAPDFDATGKAYALITTDDLDCDGTANDPSTQVVSTLGTTCAWTKVSELYWDCDVTHPFEIIYASRFAFPTDYDSTFTMFIGVTAWNGSSTNVAGGDVYRVVDDGLPSSQVAIDLNVQGYSTGCIGLKDANICSLDMTGSTDDGSLIAGAYDDYNQDPTNVYYSNDGGWTWAASKKDPTGVDRTYVLWYGSSAVAGTRWCDCAFSMSCGDEVGQYWNQISLINTGIDTVLDLSHAPEYIDGASTMYMLTYCADACGRYGSQPSTSLFRWDGTYWERVFSNFTYDDGDDALMEWVEVSPDFNTTGCLYLASTDFQMYRSVDTGCEWSALSYPCAPRPNISAWIVVDEETVLAASNTAPTTVYKTDRHGTRPWDAFTIKNSCAGIDFDLSPNISSDGNVLLGDWCAAVFRSTDTGSTWEGNYDSPASGGYPTYVQFDPGYGTSGDPGETIFYAACESVVARFDTTVIVNGNVPWEQIGSICEASGIDANGDTALYVSDSGSRDDGGSSVIEGTLAVRYDCAGYDVCSCDLDISGSAYSAISGLPCDEPLIVVAYNLYCTATGVAGNIIVQGIDSGLTMKIIIDETIAGACFSCTPVGSAVEVISTDAMLICAAAGAYCPTGVWRTLNPLDYIPDGVPFSAIIEWEILDDPSTLLSTTALLHDTATYWSDDLWLTTEGSSNILWCLDYYNPTYVWVWDDPLANPVILEAPACGGEQLLSPSSVTLSWEALDDATEYEIELYQYCPQCPDEKLEIDVPNSTDTCVIVEGLAPGTEHFWKVRVAEGEPYLSKWSELCSFTTALDKIPSLCSPVCGGKDIILTTNFSWDEVPGAASYELQIVAAGEDGTADFTGATTLTTDVNALASIPGLEYSTTYYWRVRAVTGSVPGAWAVCIFTTLDEPEEPVEPADLVVNIPEDEVITPTWMWVLIGIGAALTIAVIILIVTTRRVP